MAKKVVKTVSVFAEGEFHTFLPGDEVPSEIAKAITNPKAWGDDPGPVAEYADDESENFEGYSDDYDSQKVQDLLRMAGDRGVTPKSNKKEDVVAALREADAANPNV